jgi:PAS domain S-box-containing protein
LTNPEGHREGRTIRILFVDDDPEMCTISKRFLELSGNLEIVVVPSAFKAIEVLEECRFEAIVSDYQMPGMTGIELLKHIRESGNKVPFILFTGRGREEIAVEAYESGADHYVQKGGLPKAQFAELSHKIVSAIKQRESENALKETEDRYRKLVEEAQIGVWAIDSCFRTEFINPRMLEIIGRSFDEVEGRSPTEFMDRENRKALMAELEKRKLGDPSDYEICLVSPDGTPIHTHVRATPSLDDEGNFLGSYGLITDITKRKLAEQELRRREERYRLLVENTPLGVIAIDVYGNVTELNSKLVDILGSPSREVTSSFNILTMPLLVRSGVSDDFRHCLSTGEHVQNEVWYVSNWGNRVYLRYFLAPIHDENGDVIGVQGLVEDMSERKGMEEALRESERNLSLAMEAGNICTWELDLVNDMATFSDRIESILGYSREELEGSAQRLISLIHPDDQERFHQDSELAKSGQVRTVKADYRLIRKDGAYIWIRMIGGVKEIDEEGGPLKNIGLIIDVDEEARLSRSLSETKRKLNLLSEVTRHDILNQVNVLWGYSSMIIDDSIDDTDMHRWGLKVMETADVIKRQISFTRDYQNMGVKAPRWHAIERLIEDSFEHFRGNGMEIVLNISDLEIFADPLLEKVFFTLFENAHIHSDATTIDIDFVDEGESGILTVSDDGGGISVDNKQRVFARGVGNGSGLGLFLAKEILDITGITIREVGREGVGAVFELRIPQRDWRRAGHSQHVE